MKYGIKRLDTDEVMEKPIFDTFESAESWCDRHFYGSFYQGWYDDYADSDIVKVKGQ